MTGHTPSAFEAFRQTLAQLDCGYLCSPEPPASRVSIQFLGRFEDREIVWHMTLWALERYRAEHEDTDAPSEATRQFMNITRTPDDIFHIEVGLAVPIIDEPTILKTIVMIRNYKQLRLGRHQWGQG